MATHESGIIYDSVKNWTAIVHILNYTIIYLTFGCYFGRSLITVMISSQVILQIFFSVFLLRTDLIKTLAWNIELSENRVKINELGWPIDCKKKNILARAICDVFVKIVDCSESK